MSAKNDAGEGYDKSAAMNNLTPEELAAMNDDGLSDEDRAAMQSLAGEDGASDDDAGDDDDEGDGEGNDDSGNSDGEGEGTAQAAAAVADAAATTASGDEDGEDGEDDDSGPVYEAALPEDFADRVKALDTREDELAAKFKSGEIEADAFVAETRKIASERNELDRIQIEVNVADGLNAANATHRWQTSVKNFMKEVKSAEGIDYTKDKEKAEKFDLFVKALAGDKSNEGKSFKWYLTQAHLATKAVLGIVDKPAAGGGPKDGDAKSGKPASRQSPAKHVPANLAHVPGSDGPGDVSGDEFAEIDRLTGEAYELALAKLTAAQRERYLQAA